jgi:glycosyltransferase involved in cell wall biosynthesis
MAAAGLGDRVRLPGHVSDMPAAFAASFVTAVPSTEPEAFGRSAAESQALGCPVIASRLGAPQETVLAVPEVDSGARTGWLVAPGDAGALADALEEALQLDAAQRAVIGERARRHILAGFTLTAMKRATLQVYDRLLATRLTAAFDATCGVNRVVAAPKSA